MRSLRAKRRHRVHRNEEKPSLSALRNSLLFVANEEERTTESNINLNRVPGENCIMHVLRFQRVSEKYARAAREKTIAMSRSIVRHANILAEICRSPLDNRE